MYYITLINILSCYRVYQCYTMPSLRAWILVCEVSFKLHEELAKTLDIKSYRKLPVLSVSPGKRSSGTSDMCEWLDGEVETVRP